MTAHTDYVYVDTATGGARNRNCVMKRSKYRPIKGASDCFTTYLTFTEDLLDYAQENPSPKTGRPSVAGYPGPALAEFIPFDFDSKHPKRAVAEAAGFIRMWESRWNLPPEALRIYWSGMKGISVEVPAELFGGFEPCKHIAADLKALACVMTPGAKTFDTSIYEKLRLWRVPNTRHGTSGLYKVPITIQELTSIEY